MSSKDSINCVEKKCFYCRVTQPLQNFHTRENFPSLYKAICKNCEYKAEINKKEREDKREKAKPPQPFRGFWEHLEEAMFDDRSWTLEEIQEYEKKGVDINQAYTLSGNEQTNALQYAGEFRKKHIMEVLLQARADPNILVQGYSPLDCVIDGHTPEWCREYKHQEECIQLLLKYGAKAEIYKKVEFIDFNSDPRYEMPSEFLRNFLTKTVTIREDR